MLYFRFFKQASCRCRCPCRQHSSLLWLYLLSWRLYGARLLYFLTLPSFFFPKFSTLVQAILVFFTMQVMQIMFDILVKFLLSKTLLFFLYQLPQYMTLQIISFLSLFKLFLLNQRHVEDLFAFHSFKPVCRLFLLNLHYLFTIYFSNLTSSEKACHFCYICRMI